jgi:hypothetical protein
LLRVISGPVSWARVYFKLDYVEGATSSWARIHPQLDQVQEATSITTMLWSRLYERPVAGQNVRNPRRLCARSENGQFRIMRGGAFGPYMQASYHTGFTK